MNFIVLFVLLAVAVLVLAVLGGRARRGGSKPAIGYPYAPRRALFTPAERSFLGVLKQVTGGTHRIFGKVRLADVLKVDAGLTRSAHQIALNRITAKHLDFVLCDPTSLRVIAAIELDDKSHESTRRKQRDAFVDAALGAAGIPVHHFAARRSYSVNEVRTTLAGNGGGEAIAAVSVGSAAKSLDEGTY